MYQYMTSRPEIIKNGLRQCGIKDEWTKLQQTIGNDFAVNNMYMYLIVEHTMNAQNKCAMSIMYTKIQAHNVTIHNQQLQMTLITAVQSITTDEDACHYAQTVHLQDLAHAIKLWQKQY